MTKRQTASKKPQATKNKKVHILPCLASLHKAGLKVIPRQQVVSLTGYTKDSLRVTLCKLRKQGMVEWNDPKTVQLTKEGWESTDGSTDGERVALSNEDTQDRLKETYKISGIKAQIFDLLLDGAAHRISDIMVAVNCTNPDSFRVFCSALTSKGITERLQDPTSGDKMLQLTDMCFPLGRPNVSDSV